MLALAVIFFCLSGLIAASGAAMAFLVPPTESAGEIAVVFAVFGVLTLILWVIGAAFLRFRRSAGTLGWTLIGGGAMAATTVLMVAAGLSDPSMRGAYGPEALRAFEQSDPTAGFVAMGAMLAIGGLLVFRQSQLDKRREAAENTAVEEAFR